VIDKPILITGCARSGTSLTAAIFYYSGAWCGKVAPPDKEKRHAMVENTAIRQKLVKPYLMNIGCDPMGQDPLPRTLDIEIYDKMIEDGKGWWGNKIKEIIKGQGYKDGTWFYKGAKMCLMWPLWHAAFPKAQWIVVRRNREQIISSCMNTGFMRAYKDRKGWEKWIDIHEDRFTEMQEAGLKTYLVYPEEMIKGDFFNIQNLIEDLGLSWREDKARALINPQLWRHKNGKS
jgi:hypothetical protein